MKKKCHFRIKVIRGKICREFARFAVRLSSKYFLSFKELHAQSRPCTFYSRAYILHSTFCSTNYIFCIYENTYFAHFKSTPHFFYSFAERTSSDLLPRRDTDSLFSRQMNIPAPSGNSMATAQSPFYGDREMLSPAHQPPCLVLYLLSLSPYHSRRLPVSPSPSPLRRSSRCISSLFLALWQDTAATDNIYYKTWPSMLAFHARVSLYSGQSEKRNSLPDDEEAVDRRTHQQHHFVPLFNSASLGFLLSLDFIIVTV